MKPFDVTPPGRFRHLLYLAALAVTVACLGWLSADFASALAGGAEPFGLLRKGLLLLAVPFGPTLFLLVLACWLGLTGRPAPVSIQILAAANAAWSVLLTSALVTM